MVREILKIRGADFGKKMMVMNAQVKLEKKPEAQVAADFLAKNLNVQVKIKKETAGTRFWRHTWDHLTLVGISLLGAIVVAIPLGIVAFQWARGGQVILGLVGIIQTIPSLALLVFYDSVVGDWRGACDCGAVFVQFAAHCAKYIRGIARYFSRDTRVSCSIGFVRLGTTSIGNITDGLAVDSGGY